MIKKVQCTVLEGCVGDEETPVAAISVIHTSKCDQGRFQASFEGGGGVTQRLLPTYRLKVVLVAYKSVVQPCLPDGARLCCCRWRHWLPAGHFRRLLASYANGRSLPLPPDVFVTIDTPFLLVPNPSPIF